MINAWHAVASKTRRGFRLIVLYCILRFVVGIAAIAIFDRDAIAWGHELTMIVTTMVAVYVLVALAVRRYAPPRRPAVS